LLGAIAHSNEHTPKPTRPAENTRRRPSRSPRDPPTSSSDDSVSRYASTIHCWSARLPWRSARIDGSATFTTVPSRNTMPEPRMLDTSTICLRLTSAE
jgi:hypothetical protein